MTRPLAPLPAALVSAVRHIAATPHLLVALDFDGTMAPLVARAEDARPLPRSAAALAALSSMQSTTTALVSGRALASLRAVAAPPAPTLLVGSHGAESWWGPESPALELTAVQAAALERARALVTQVTTLYEGTVQEDKPSGVALHYRQASEADGRAAVDHVRNSVAQDPAIYLGTGKMVLELSVLNANKGQSLTTLRERTQATATFFAGDDVTDEHAFAALLPGDLGVKVGQGETAAGFRIAAPAALPQLLELLVSARREFLHVT